jgi:hypothetical protein
VFHITKGEMDCSTYHIPPFDTLMRNRRCLSFFRGPPTMTTLQSLIETSTVSDLKEMLAYFPDACKVGRKEVLVASLWQQMSGDGMLRAWEQLDACQRLAVGEATYDTHGIFHGKRFAAKYGQWPLFHHDGGQYRSRGALTALGPFMHWIGDHLVIPADLRPRLKGSVPSGARQPAAAGAGRKFPAYLQQAWQGDKSAGDQPADRMC